MSDFLVTSAKDHGPGTLRAAITQAAERVIPNVKIEIAVSGCIQLLSPIVIASPGTVRIWKGLQQKEEKEKKVTKDKLDQVILSGAEIQVKDGCVTGLYLSHLILERGSRLVIESSSCKVCLTQVQIRSNRAEKGGAILSYGPLRLDNCQLTHNQALIQGGAIWADNSVVLVETVVAHNQVTSLDSAAAAGGGLYLDSGPLVANRSRIEENQVAYDAQQQRGGLGGAAVILAGQVNLTGCHIVKNRAFQIGGISQGIGDVVIHESCLSFNESFAEGSGATGGGAIAISFGNLTLSQSRVEGNITKGMFSGGILSLLGNVSVLNESVVAQNRNFGPGGGIAANALSIVTVAGKSQVVGNSGSSLGGGIVNFSPSGGAVVVQDSRVAGNTVTAHQTIGGTVLSFLQVVQPYLDSVSASASESDGKGAKTWNETVPEIQAQLQQLQEELKYLSGLHAIAGGGIATLTSAGTHLIGSHVEKNHLDNLEKDSIFTKGAGVFAQIGPISLVDSSITQNESNADSEQVMGSGVFNGTSLISQDSKICKNSPAGAQVFSQPGALVLHTPCACFPY